MWQCKKCCTENEDQLSYCKNCGMSKAKSLRQPRLNKKKNKKKPIKEIGIIYFNLVLLCKTKLWLV